MLKARHLVVCFVILFLSLVKSYSQVTITGIVLDSISNKPLHNSYVTLLHNTDSTKIFLAKTTQTGLFVFKNIPKASYTTKTTYVGYQTSYQSIDLAIDIPQKWVVYMSKASQVLDEVTVVAKVQAIVQKQDTVQFSAKAFKVNPDANADELLEKMPGTTLENGKLNVQGEEVKQVMIDGKLYFGKDATAAMKNLPAEVIDKIQVFDQQSEQSQLTGVDDGNTVKTINIITRPDMRNGVFGRNYLGFGNKETYKFNSSINRFIGDSKLTFLAQTNNVNQQNFSSEDLIGVANTASATSKRRGGESGSGLRDSNKGGISGGDNTSNFLVANQDGYNVTNAFGLNFSNEWKNGIKFQGSYFFNKSSNETDENSFRQYILTQAQLNSQRKSLVQREYAETNNSVNNSFNHRAYARIEWKLNENNSLIVTPNISYQSTNYETNLKGLYYLLDSSTNQVINFQKSSNNAFVWNNSALFRHKFSKLGRSLMINITLNGNDRNADKILTAKGTLATKQSSTTLSNSIAYATNIYYSEPISRSTFGFLSAGYSFNNNDSDKNTYNFDEIENKYSLLDTLFSNVFNSGYTNYKFGTGLRKISKILFISAELRYQQADLKNEQLFPAAYELDKSFTNLLPSLSVRYNINGKDKNLKFSYQTSTQQPSITQLQEVRNNTNLLKISIGNSNLKQEYHHQFTFRYTATNPKSFASFVALLSANIIKGNITNTTTDIEVKNKIGTKVAGQLIKPFNLEGQYAIKAFTSFGFPIKYIQSNLNTNFSATMGNIPGLINNILNTSQTQKYVLGVVLSSNISQNVDFTFTSNSHLNYNQNTILTSVNTDYYSQTLKGKLNVIFPHSYLLNIDVSNVRNTGLSESFNQNFTLLNLALAKKFLKKNQAELRLSVFDLLNLNKSIDRNIANNYIEDTQSNVLQRYFMLTFSYNLKKYFK